MPKKRRIKRDPDDSVRDLTTAPGPLAQIKELAERLQERADEVLAEGEDDE